MKPQASTTTTGLDIGSHSIKFVEMQRGDTPELVRAGIEPANHPGGLCEIVKKLKLTPGNIRISLSGPSILVRRIVLPVMTAGELKGAIRFEAESHIPFSIDDCVLDSQILSHTPDKKSMYVLLAAAKKDLIDARLKTLAECALEPELVDVDVFCLLNAFETLNSETPQKNYALLNIGHRTSSFMIVHENQPFIVREITAGAAQQEGIADRVAADVRQSIDYFENESGDELGTLWASGGGALVAGTLDRLTEDLGKKVSLWNNTKKLKIGPAVSAEFLAAHSAELNVALGMALRGVK